MVFVQETIYLKIKGGAYIINLNEYESIGTHWIALYFNDNNVIYFASFGVQHIPRKFKKFIGNKNVLSNTYRIQGYDSIKCEYFCICIYWFYVEG